MRLSWPGVEDSPPGRARLRTEPEDFQVAEQLGFEPDGVGEHVFLHLQKRSLNTVDLVERVGKLAGIGPADIGYSGLKDRNAVTRQWLSVRMAGQPEPEWRQLEAQGDVVVLAQARHRRKLKRGVHRANIFNIRLRRLEGPRADLEKRLQRVRADGVPNYFGEQRFGRGGSTLQQAQRWMAGGGRRLSRSRRGLYFSALRGWLFNTLLADRVTGGDWNRIADGDVCMLQGSRSFFPCPLADAELEQRAAGGDIHPGLPLWGRGEPMAGAEQQRRQAAVLAAAADTCRFLESAGLTLAYRPSRVLADDFYWQFCDDGSLQLGFALPAGAYATAVLAELLLCEEEG